MLDVMLNISYMLTICTVHLHMAKTYTAIQNQNGNEVISVLVEPITKLHYVP